MSDEKLWEKLDQEFKRAWKFVEYHQQYLTMHFFDGRDGPDRNIELDAQTRQMHAYAKKLVELANNYRSYAGASQLD